MRNSIPTTRERPGRTQLKSTSLRALAVAARLERDHDTEGPPGDDPGRAEHRRARRTPDPA